MTAPRIRFGTDGWRAVIAEDFTFDNVRHVASAIARHLRTLSAAPRVTVGYDTRFHSAAFARAVSGVLRANGCETILSRSALSTPALSSSVVDRRAHGGIMISASHNPPDFNGIKFKTSRGGSAPETVTAAFESYLGSPSKGSFDGGSITEADLTDAYLRRVSGFVDMKAIRRSHMTLIADPMYGAGIGYLPRLLERSGINIRSIHAAPDPLFGGLHPEPIEAWLGDLKRAVNASGAAAGLATDGDADRIGVVDDKGRYLTPHQVFPLLLHYLCHYKGMKGKVVQTISLGYVSERMAKDKGLEWEEVPVGFKYIAERFENEDVLMGGEESGGYGYGAYLPERDGILNSLMLVEMLAVTGKRMSVLLREIEKKYGASCYLRTDFRNPGIPKDDFVRTLRGAAPSRIAGRAVREIRDYDGIEFILEDDSWLLLRPSGTEPVIRVYSESSSFERTKKIISWGNGVVRKLSPTSCRR